MSLTAIDVASASTFYLEAGEVHGDIVSPVIGDLAIYTYAAAGEFIGKEYSYSGSAWFAREQITETESGKAAGLVVIGGNAGGQGFNREDATPVHTAPEKFTWPEGSRPATINVILEGCTVGESVLFVCFDAPDAATAAAWLAGAAGEAVDSQRYAVLPASVVGTEGVGNPGGKEFEFTSPMSNMYYILEAADATAKLYVEAS